jgi:hypothetical protein
MYHTSVSVYVPVVYFLEKRMVFTVLSQLVIALRKTRILRQKKERGNGEKGE